MNCGEHMLDHFEAIKSMHEGNVVQYVGTDDNPTVEDGRKICMFYGGVFGYDNGVNLLHFGAMIYHPKFRYKLTGETVENSQWKLVK